MLGRCEFRGNDCSRFERKKTDEVQSTKCLDFSSVRAEILKTRNVLELNVEDLSAERRPSALPSAGFTAQTKLAHRKIIL